MAAGLGLRDLILMHNSVSISVSMEERVAVRINTTDTLIATGVIQSGSPVEV